MLVRQEMLFFWFFKKCILLIMLLHLPRFFPLLDSSPTSIPPTPAFSSCPWVIHISSLASPFPKLFLTSPCLLCTYHLCFLFPALFPPFSSFLLSPDNAPCDPHFCDSVPVLVGCFVCFCFCVFRFSCW